MGNTFFIADTHFGHANVLHFDSRPFSSINEMDLEMIRMWNARVGKDDDVYVLGDFAYRNGTWVGSYTTRLNGRIHLIRGNHDKRNSQYEACFEDVHDILNVAVHDGERMRQVTLCHYFIPSYVGKSRNAIMLHGHSHVGNEYTPEEEIKKYLNDVGIRCEAYNVGCMHIGYVPRTLREIIDTWKEKRIWKLIEESE